LLIIILDQVVSRIFEVVVNDVYSAEYEYCDPTLQPVSDPLAA